MNTAEARELSRQIDQANRRLWAQLNCEDYARVKIATVVRVTVVTVQLPREEI